MNSLTLSHLSSLHTPYIQKQSAGTPSMQTQSGPKHPQHPANAAPPTITHTHTAPISQPPPKPPTSIHPITKIYALSFPIHHAEPPPTSIPTSIPTATMCKVIPILLVEIEVMGGLGAVVLLYLLLRKRIVGVLGGGMKMRRIRRIFGMIHQVLLPQRKTLVHLVVVWMNNLA